jgi:hypothetical protein
MAGRYNQGDVGQQTRERNNYEQLLIRGMKGKLAALWLSLIDTLEFLRLKP